MLYDSAHKSKSVLLLCQNALIITSLFAHREGESLNAACTDCGHMGLNVSMIWFILCFSGADKLTFSFDTFSSRIQKEMKNVGITRMSMKLKNFINIL